MIILYHNTSKVVNVVSGTNQSQNLTFDKTKNIASIVIDLAIRYPESKIIWCDVKYQDYLNLEEITTVFHQDKMMLSYTPDLKGFLNHKIGYIDQSLFIKVSKEVTFPTWQMSNLVGGVHAKIILKSSEIIKPNSNFDYYLSSIAKVSMPLGLLCYSEPRLLTKSDFLIHLKTSRFTLFRFVKQHYKTRWIFILFLNLMIFELKFPLLPLLYSSFFKNRNKYIIKLDDVQIDSSTVNITDTETIDVIIPTIGRKQYLYDVLVDLSKQTILPKNVIIVEQNAEPNSSSELDYLINEKWPFQIKHTFTHRTGACNARNVALDQVESKWVFLNDDDNRFGPDLLNDALLNLLNYKLKVLSSSYLQPNETKINKYISQSTMFGSGNSFMHSSLLEKVRFNDKFEFGYGEDSDFGMQIRKQGYDILYFPDINISHLKAPFGGFRTKPKLAWSNAEIQPKPSPTILLYKILHQTKEQQNGSKLLLFLKYYNNQSIKNPFGYFLKFQKEWKSSLYWANQLNKNA